MPPSFPSHGGVAASEDGRYVYADSTRVDDGTGAICCIVLLRPSGPPSPAMLDFARHSGCGTLLRCHVFGFVALDMADFLSEGDPVGPDADRHILAAASSSNAGPVVAWGSGGSLMDRDTTVLALLARNGIRPSCRGTDRHGFPSAPPRWAGPPTPYSGRNEA